MSDSYFTEFSDFLKYLLANKIVTKKERDFLLKDFEETNTVNFQSLDKSKADLVGKAFIKNWKGVLKS